MKDKLAKITDRILLFLSHCHFLVCNITYLHFPFHFILLLFFFHSFLFFRIFFIHLNFIFSVLSFFFFSFIHTSTSHHHIITSTSPHHIINIIITPHHHSHDREGAAEGSTCRGEEKDAAEFGVARRRPNGGHHGRLRGDSAAVCGDGAHHTAQHR